MNSKVLIAVLLVMVIAVTASACKKKVEAPETGQVIDGGVTNTEDPAAPKKIESKTIITFHCYVNLGNLEEKDSRLGGYTYDFEARLENGAVKGTYKKSSYDGMEEKPFRESHEFLNEIFTIVDKYDFAQFNGKKHFVAGLPEDFGSTIEINFKSGEKINASDNQGSFLPVEAVEELEALFRSRLN
ncbi:MAG: hypothetical protein Q4B67_05690 [Eubacteriales bacterium]|nr:hypothetical protein [Eubacteriales bacterium]